MLYPVGSQTTHKHRAVMHSASQWQINANTTLSVKYKKHCTSTTIEHSGIVKYFLYMFNIKSETDKIIYKTAFKQ